MLEVRSLRRALIPHSLLQNPSPGSLQSTRLALHVNESSDSCSVYIASGCNVYKIAIGMEDLEIERGKDSLLIPMPARVVEAMVVGTWPHSSEIKSVVLADTNCQMGPIVGTVDSHGHAIISRMDAGREGFEGLTYMVSPRDCGLGEGSWAGLCFSPERWSKIAVGRNLCKSIDIYDQDKHIQSLQTLWNPASLCFLQGSVPVEGGSSILAVAEGCQLTIWDLRTTTNGGCIQRISGSLGNPFYAVCCSSEGAIAVGGIDRSVTIYDSRRWSPLSRWANCSKYEITGLVFSSLDSNHLYMQGVDYEVSCGNWKGNRKEFSFRGDSNWLGFSKCSRTDVLAGWCESGNVFVADVAKRVNKNGTVLEPFDATLNI